MEQPAPLQKMVDLFCERYAAGKPTFIDDLYRAGFSSAQIYLHLSEATKRAKKRLSIQ